MISNIGNDTQKTENMNEEFMAVAHLIEEIFPERNKSIYFESTASKELVEEVRKNNPHLISPWDTEAGKRILALGLETDLSKRPSWADLSELRRRMIHTFTRRASGNFTIVFSENNIDGDDSMLSNIVLNTLMLNRNVRTINNQNKNSIIDHHSPRDVLKPTGRVFKFKPKI